MKKATYLCCFLAVSALNSGAASAQETDKFIAGTKPWQRPESAPVLTEYAKDAQWYGKALAGVMEPYPYSLRFLEDQGGWFNPFTKPGMSGPYDIRGWH